MTGKEIVKEILHLRGWSQSKLAEDIGKSQTNITGYLNRGKNEMRLDVFVKMVEAMGYEVIVRDKMGFSGKWRVEYTGDKESDTLLSTDETEPKRP